MNDHRATNFRRSIVVAVSLIGASICGATVGGKFASAAEDEGFGSNLSVPAIFVPGSSATGAPALRGGECAGATSPRGSMSLEYPGYYLQKSEPVWQAECSEVSSLDVTANWGDNLTSRPVLSSRQPIRVEVGLEYEPAVAMKGFVVEKLNPDIEDRLATYGTRGDAVDFAKVRVFDAGVTLRIERIDGPGGVIYDGPMSAEVNSVGAIVYGYNWGVKGKTNRALPGNYRISFTTNNTRIVGVDSSDAQQAAFTPRSTTVDISVSASAGVKGGSGKGGSSGTGGHNGSGQGGPR